MLALWYANLTTKNSFSVLLRCFISSQLWYEYIP